MWARLFQLFESKVVDHHFDPIPLLMDHVLQPGNGILYGLLLGGLFAKKSHRVSTAFAKQGSYSDLNSWTLGPVEYRFPKACTASVSMRISKLCWSTPLLRVIPPTWPVYQFSPEAPLALRTPKNWKGDPT